MKGKKEGEVEGTTIRGGDAEEKGGVQTEVNTNEREAQWREGGRKRPQGRRTIRCFALSGKRTAYNIRSLDSSSEL